MNATLKVIPGFIENGIFTAMDLEKVEPLTNQGLHDHDYTELEIYLDTETYERLKEFDGFNAIKSKDLYRHDMLVPAVIAGGGYFIKSFMNGECKELAKDETLDTLISLMGTEKLGFAVLIPKHMTFV